MNKKLIIELNRFQAKLLQIVIAHGKPHLSDTSELDEVVEQLEDFTGSASLVFRVPRRK